MRALANERRRVLEILILPDAASARNQFLGAIYQAMHPTVPYLLLVRTQRKVSTTKMSAGAAHRLPL